MSAPTWEGIYETFAEARADTEVFEGHVWLDKVTQRAEHALAAASRDASLIPAVAVTTEYALPFLAAVAARRDTPLRILDFGGGMATSYVPLRAMLPPEQHVEFVVVENEPLCKRGSDLFKADTSVRFVSRLPSAPDAFDVVHFGSSFHYVDDWRGLLREVSALSPTWLLFADLTAGDNVSFVTAQRFHERRIPVRFWNLREFIEGVESLGFDLTLKARYRGYYLAKDAELPTSNFDTEHRLTYTSQLIFRSRASRTPF